MAGAFMQKGKPCFNMRGIVSHPLLISEVIAYNYRIAFYIAI